MLVWFFSFPREAMGAERAPGIPCALFIEGTWFSPKLGRNASREGGIMSMLFDKSNRKSGVGPHNDECDGAHDRRRKQRLHQGSPCFGRIGSLDPDGNLCRHGIYNVKVRPVAPGKP